MSGWVYQHHRRVEPTVDDWKYTCWWDEAFVQQFIQQRLPHLMRQTTVVMDREIVRMTFLSLVCRGDLVIRTSHRLFKIVPPERNLMRTVQYQVVEKTNEPGQVGETGVLEWFWSSDGWIMSLVVNDQSFEWDTEAEPSVDGLIRKWLRITSALHPILPTDLMMLILQYTQTPLSSPAPVTTKKRKLGCFTFVIRGH